MASLARRRSHRDTNIWPGFVDALATLLLVLVFVLLIFVMAQFFLSEALSGRDVALGKLRTDLQEISSLLDMERKSALTLRADVGRLSGELEASLAEKTSLERALADSEQARSTDKERIEAQLAELATLAQQVAAMRALKEELEKEVAAAAARTETTETALLEERKVSESTRAQLALLNQQTEALREQMKQIQEALDISEKLAAEQNIQITSLGQRLNAALATKVQELARYRSEFFGRLREVLGDKPDVRVVGDRFVFQSEVLFETGSADLGQEGKEQLGRLAGSLKEIAGHIPEEILWVLQVDGHTDRVPIYNWRFPSNWELSTARAVSVVKHLIEQGIPPERLAATGFGQYQPLDDAQGDEANRRNRRIELKLTQR